MTSEVRGPSKVTQAHHWVVQNKVYLTYPCRENVKTFSLQQLETWLIHPTTLLLFKGQMETKVIVMVYGPLVSTPGMTLCWHPPRCGWSHLVLWGFPLVPTVEVCNYALWSRGLASFS